MAEIINTPEGSNAVQPEIIIATAPVVSGKKSHKTLFIVLGIIAVLMLCGCVIAFALIFILPYINVTSADTKFIGYINEYRVNVQAISTNWESVATCNKDTEYKAIYSKSYSEDEVASLYDTVTNLLTAEKTCYQSYRSYEIAKDQPLYNEVKDFDCAGVTKVNNCKAFISDLAAIISVNTQINTAYDDYYGALIDNNVCYIKALEDNYGDNVAKKAAEAVCDKEYVDHSATLQDLNSQYSDLDEELTNIVYETLGITVTPTMTPTVTPTE